MTLIFMSSLWFLQVIKKGDIVLIRFPFITGMDFKIRPVLVPRDQDDEDITLLPISTHIKKRKHDLLIEEKNYKGQPLPVASVIRMGKINTLHNKLMAKKVTELQREFFKEVQLKLFRFLT